MSATRLPGVYFETVVPAVPEWLPRMDIPAFVGFAASGPLDVPVAVEDIVRFHEIFGQDQPLAWDLERGEMAYAQLAPAVRAFFRNRGQRCWVVRVADNASARTNRFLVPGLLQAADNSYGAAWGEARSEGSWSDDLSINATLTWEPVAIDALEHSDSGYAGTLPAGVHSVLSAGDMLQLVYSGAEASPPAEHDAILFLPLRSIASAPAGSSAGLLPPQHTVFHADRGFWFRSATADDFALTFSPASDSPIVWLEAPRAVWRLAAGMNAPLPLRAWGFSAAQNHFVIDVLRADAAAIQPGSWILLEFDSMALPEGATALLLQVGSIGGSGEGPPSVSPPLTGDQETALLVAAGAWWALDEDHAVARYAPAPQVTVVRLELWIRNLQGEVTRLEDLRLAPRHPRYLGYLPSDAELFRETAVAGTRPGEELRQEASHPRFPLAAPANGSEPIYVPLAVPVVPNDLFYQAADEQTASALERDGLGPPASGGPSVGAEIFLDPDLGGTGVNTLLAEAFHKQYQLPRRDGAGIGEPLVKMHAVLPVGEASLLAVPDAIQRGWTTYDQEQHLLVAPQLLSISEPDAAGNVTVAWTAVEGANSYTLQRSTVSRFDDAVQAWTQITAQSASVPVTDRCPTPSHFRVRATGVAGLSPWSKTGTTILPPETFGMCKPERLDPPVLTAPAESRGRTILQWSMPIAGDCQFRLEMSAEPAFEFPQVLYEGGQSSFEVWRSPARITYFRVAATLPGRISPWSNTVSTHPEKVTSGWRMLTADEAATSGSEEEMLRVHKALLRLCAARADLMAVISLPRDYRRDSVLAYKDRLVRALAPEEIQRTLSFGALFHPWLVVRDAGNDSPDAVRTVVPDGTICGTMAARTLASGAWSSPANQLLLGVVDLFPVLDDSAPALFYEGQINTVSQEARGFLCMSAYTLMPGNEFSEVNVRRLLILLRRLALREGMTYVFEVNNDSLRYLVRRRFEEVLGNLFAHGAFAGDTQAEAFRVVTDSSVNTPEMIDQGRLVVELRVAPSLPLSFITVRLMQTGGEMFISEEA